MKLLPVSDLQGHTDVIFYTPEVVLLLNECLLCLLNVSYVLNPFHSHLPYFYLSKFLLTMFINNYSHRGTIIFNPIVNLTTDIVEKVSGLITFIYLDRK